MLNEVRGWAKGTLPTYQDRKAFFEGIVNGEPDPVELVRAGDRAAVRDLIAAAQQSCQRRPASRTSTREARVRMVDVGAKAVTERGAEARGIVRMSPARRRRSPRGGRSPRATSSGIARVAGIQAAKRTAELIPSATRSPSTTWASTPWSMPRPGPGRGPQRRGRPARTGVEMEAMHAAAVAALTVYDMVKDLERDVTVEEVALLEKSGGRSGAWRRNG